MSFLPCSYCGDFADTDGDGEWEVPKINSNKKYDFVCGMCCEKYLTENGQLDPELEAA